MLAVGIAALIFFYSGTFFNWPGVKGLYQTFEAWFKTGHKGNGHEKPWYYWLMLIGRYELADRDRSAGLRLLPDVQEITVRYLAIYGVGTLMAYSIVAYKTPWCIISIVWPLLLRLRRGACRCSPQRRAARGPNRRRRVCSLVSLGQSIRLNYFRCTTDTEPYVYVQTYNDIYKLTDPLLELARRNPINYQLVGHMIRTSAYPLPWILGDFTGRLLREGQPPDAARCRFPRRAGGQDRDRGSEAAGRVLHDAVHDPAVSGHLEALPERARVSGVLPGQSA